MYQIAVVFLLLNMPTNVFGVTVEKLFLTSLTVNNKTQSKQEAAFETNTQCPRCHDNVNHKHIIRLNPKEKTVFNPPSKRIANFTCSSNDLHVTIEKRTNTTGLKQASIELIDTAKNQSKPSFRDKDFFYLSCEAENFAQCMSNDMPQFFNYLPGNMQPSDALDFFKKLYDKNHPAKKTRADTTIIPKIIHQNWFGVTGDIPDLYRQWQKEWRKKHPGWQFICWNEEMLKLHFPQGLTNQKTFEIAKQERNYAKMSDVVRYEVIEKFGGLYIDCDTQCFESFDLLHENYEFYACLEAIVVFLSCANCIFGAKPHHPVMQQCIKNINLYETSPPPIDQFAFPVNYPNDFKPPKMRDTLMRTGPGVLTKSVLEASKITSNDIILPNCFFCPHPHFELETFSMHDFGCPVKTKTEHWVDIASK